LKALRVLGWIFVPYVMIFVSWKGLRGAGKTFGIVWALFAAISTINAINSDDTATKQMSAAPVATIEAKTLSNEEKEAKAKFSTCCRKREGKLIF
jgi:hypothetical protein